MLAQHESRREQAGRAVKSFRLSKDLMPEANVGETDWNGIVPVVCEKDWRDSLTYQALRTEVRSCWSRNFVYFAFSCRYRHLNVSDNPRVAKKTMHLWDRDVVEVYLQPPSCGSQSYYEFEISPAGEWLDLYADVSRNIEDFSWESGMKVASKIDAPRRVWHAVCRIPKRSFGCNIKAGDIWKGNFYRIDGKDDRTFLAWSPTMTPEARFGVPERFSMIRFVGYSAAAKRT